MSYINALNDYKKFAGETATIEGFALYLDSNYVPARHEDRKRRCAGCGMEILIGTVHGCTEE